MLTLEIEVDMNQELKMKMHATHISGQMNQSSYRSECLKDSTNLHVACMRRLSDITNGTGGVSQGLTLAWDEFQLNSAENSPSRQREIPSEAIITGVNSMSSFQATSTAFNSLEKLLSTVPASQMVFNSPIKETVGENSHLSLSMGAGPNTSTPAIDLDHIGENPRVENISNEFSKSVNELTSQSIPNFQVLDVDVTKKRDFCINQSSSDAYHDGYLRTHDEVKEYCEPMQTTPDEISGDEFCLGNKLMNYDTMMAQDDNVKMVISENDDKTSCLTPLEQVNGSQVITEESNIENGTDSDHESLSKNLNLARVQEYLQSLPSPARRDPLPVTPRFKNVNSERGSLSVASPCSPGIDVDEGNVSVCSGSASLHSRQSDLSSLTGSRLNRGLFSGVLEPNNSNPVCPFPTDWQFNTIPESIENDEDID